MRIIIVVSFIIVSAYIGTSIIKGFADTMEKHKENIERVAGY